MKIKANTTHLATNDLTRQFRKRRVLDTASELQRFVCARSLSDYIREAWPILNPLTWYLPNWHIDLISEYLQACSTGQIHRLIVNLPPKGTKSTVVSVMWPTWCWGPQNQAGTRWMFASYSEKVSTRDSLARRTLLTSLWYTGHWGSRVRLIADQNQKTIFQNAARGQMLATTMGGQGTGLGGQYLVIDDPHDTEKIISDKERQRALHNFDHKLYTRLDDRKTGVIVIIMQRLHTKDLTGHLLEGIDGARWEHLSIPMEAPAEKVYVFPISKKEYAREEGGLLNPVREGPAELGEHKARLGSYGYASQFQQTPLPAGGGVFKLQWFKLWPKLDSEGNEHSAELPQFDQIVQSWDTAIKDKETNSYTVCTTWGVCDLGYFLLDVWRKHVEFPDMMHGMHDLAAHWRPQAILVENKSSGQSAIQELRRSTLPVIAIDVDTDKTARARAAAPKAESGKIWIIRHASWARLYLDELCNFPKSEFNDQVDSTSQFINWMHESSFGLMACYRAENEKVRLEKIRCGLPVRYLIPGMLGSAVYICAYPGCGKELIPNESAITQCRGLRFCCQEHAW
jgi:predicted phage terminase large subunit-like protein